MKRTALLAAVALMCTSCVKPLGDTYTITVKTNNASWGTASGGGEYIDGATATLTATPIGNAGFLRWEDGVTNNPRTVKVTRDATYTALFNMANPQGTSASVAFGGYTWPTVLTTYMYYYTQASALAGYLLSNSNAQYPYAYIQLYNFHNGTTTYTADQNGWLDNGNNAIEYYKNTSYYSVNDSGDTSYYGDWWCKTGTVSVSNFDATACKGTVSINATMFSVDDYVNNNTPVSNCSTAQFTVNLNEVTFGQR